MQDYERVKVLGKGSFGQAVLVRRKSDKKELVAKEVDMKRMNRKEREEAIHEVKMLKKLRHPNIVGFYDNIEERGTLNIIMEYCDGGDLYGVTQKQRFRQMPERQVLHYFTQVCLALDYMHASHVLHRDIKSMNVFLMKDGTVKLGDFGISTVLRHTMGLAATVLGTPYYFSPELARNKPYNNKSDVWAAGVLLYELAELRHPFDGQSMAQLMAKITRGVYKQPSSKYSRELREVINLCLEKDPARRPSMRSLLKNYLIKMDVGDQLVEAIKTQLGMVEEPQTYAEQPALGGRVGTPPPPPHRSPSIFQIQKHNSPPHVPTPGISPGLNQLYNDRRPSASPPPPFRRPMPRNVSPIPLSPFANRGASPPPPGVNMRLQQEQAFVNRLKGKGV